MRQHILPLWKTQHLTTYSDIVVYREEHYPRRGPVLVRKLQEEIGSYVEDGDQSRLDKINRLILDLSALNPEWFEFSTEVFRAHLAPSQTAPKLLQSLFHAALRQMTKRVA